MKMRYILHELDTHKVDNYISKLDSLPKGAMFNDAKKITGIFHMSSHSWNDTINTFEINKNNKKLELIDIRDIKITQPNIQVNNVMRIISHINDVPTLDVVNFKDGTLVIFDGHHRLIAYWLLRKFTIKANVVEER